MATDEMTLPRSVEGVFRDYLGRRTGIIKALTTDVEDFYCQCDPERENQCLYGLPNETWKVTLPEEEVPPELPEPALGVNFARDGMVRRDWLALVAVHSDAWLMAVAFFLGARFDRNERNSLFQMINNLPTILDVVAGRVKPLNDGPSVNSPPASTYQPRARKKPMPKSRSFRAEEDKTTDDDSKEDSSDAIVEEDLESGEDEDEYEDQENSICGICGGRYAPTEFWIFCDSCKKWFHGKCVKVTPARAEHIKRYKCPLCIQKRPRPHVLSGR